MSTPARRAYTLPEAADLLGIPVSTLYQQAREGRCSELQPIRVGRTTRFPKQHIDRLVEGAA